ncbi:hypothetical protein CDL12_02753 [Handroanthus impetiginosus]|uniref:MORF/ORRM1/DAG-like MORF domain-containing protein n=1 Tax=Handroanthus impetiginosus TaxID=429701 RepID=A0A2G9I4G9_9LAMI|nr:hypothetical protein CDL12_02753 [Handroanthus impetiginosus]
MALALNMEALVFYSPPTAATATVPVAGAATTVIPTFLAKPPTNSNLKIPPLTVSFPIKTTPQSSLFHISCFSSSLSRTVRAEATSTSTSWTAPLGKYDTGNDNRHWMVLVETPPQELTTKSQIIDYYVSKLQSVLGSEKDAQMCMYDASCDTHFGFCCEIDQETAHELANTPGVLSVKPDPDLDSTKKDYSFSKLESNSKLSPSSTLLFPPGTTKHWLVRMDRPAIGAIRKAQ